MPNIEQMIEQVFQHAAGRPMWQGMREDEQEAGNAVVLPGTEPWFPAGEWDETSVVSRKGKEIRLIAIMASNPGHGAFRRLVDGIIAAGLVPVILAPVREMRETMKRWGWAPRHVGSGWNHEEQWRPKKGWRRV